MGLTPVFGKKEITGGGSVLEILAKLTINTGNVLFEVATDRQCILLGVSFFLFICNCWQNVLCGRCRGGAEVQEK